MEITIIDLNKSVDLTTGTDTLNAVFMVDGELEPYSLLSTDPLYGQALKLIKDGLETEEQFELLRRIMVPETAIESAIEENVELSGNLTLQNGRLFFQEHELDPILTEFMLKLLKNEDQEKWKIYTRFIDNLYQNVNEDVREQLFRWLNYEGNDGRGFTITEDGCIIGYKGCEGTVTNATSIFEGNAYVDGVFYENSKIPNRVGSVVSMPRSEVTFDPHVGCSVGLHVGTYDYASSWGNILLTVKVNPRDIVSVPYECSSQKMRVCEYTVLGEAFLRNMDTIQRVSDDYDYEDGSDFTIDEFEEYEDCELYVEYEGKEFQGHLIEIHYGHNPGIVLKDYDNGEYKHIKLYRLEYYEVIE